MKIKRIVQDFFVAAYVLGLAACASAPEPSGFDEANNIVSNNVYPEGAPATRIGSLEQSWTTGGKSITFSNGQYSGFTGCNNFEGRYSLVGSDVVVIQPMVMPSNICPNKDPRFMQEEANFAQSLPGEYSIRYQGDTMVLLNDQRSWVFAAN